ncbi:MAG: TIGR00300 family protein [Acidobacteria bacterium]|nr:TIGR00300 family protein [Acidobacteriota bacterium]
MATERIEIEGHIIDSLILAKVLDLIVAAGADYQVVAVDIGRTQNDPSRVVLDVSALDDDSLSALLETVQVHGANRLAERDAVLVACDRDGVLPEGFYSTTNLPTSVRLDGRWHPVVNPEMDCGLIAGGDEVRTVPMHRVRAGDEVVVGYGGVRVEAPSKARGVTFEFMSSEVSSEKPKALLVSQVADRLRAARAQGTKILVVAGPAVVHTGAAPPLATLVREGWVDLLFAGNGFATHDMESNVLGTSLGVSIDAGLPIEHGHSNHLRVINEIRRRGSIAQAVADGYVTGGVMYECVRRGLPFVLGGSVRDDGPLPDVYADVVAAVDAMRENIAGVGVALMLASTLHAIATGNILPAGVETFCVDINQAVVTKLADRGSHQALGIVTDVGLFVRDLTEQLCPR